MDRAFYADDIICGIAASGGSIGIIRVSGADSLLVAHRIFLYGKDFRKIDEFESHRVYYGHISFNGDIIDEVLLTVMKAPRSYTCEDVFEIHCHGGAQSLRKILEVLTFCGVRHAERGEFTKRAFLNGRIDLTQAEAVLDIINAKTDLSRFCAVNQLEGKVSGVVRSFRDEILSMIANIEVNIDYPENDTEEISNDTIRLRIEHLKSEIEHILETAEMGRIIRDGIKVVIIGKPNVGKSSVMNVLLKEERSIVTDIPGTTRDALHEYVNINDIPYRITDTAGIRDTSDTIERIGVERAEQYANDADLLFVTLDMSTELTKEDLHILEFAKESRKKTLILLNKSDLLSESYEYDCSGLNEYVESENIIKISAVLNQGFDKLGERLSEIYFTGEIRLDGEAVISNIRHKNALINSLTSLNNAITASESGLSQEFISIDLMEAYAALGEITGDSVDEDLVEKIFSEFCLGK